MKKYLYILSFILSTPLLAGCSEEKPLTVAKDGAAAVAIVTSDTPTECEKYAAKELREHLGKITGADFKVLKLSEAKDAPSAIYVGDSKKSRELIKDFDPATAKFDAVRLKKIGDNIVLTGHEKRGTLYAVYTFLEDELGVKWWADDETFIPQKKSIEIEKLDTSYAPQLTYRRVDYRVGESSTLAARWKSGILSMHNIALQKEINDYFAIWCHSYFKVLPPEKYFKDHPEWFSEIGGKRVHEDAQLCLTNEEMFNEFIKNVLEKLRKNRQSRFVHISQNDWNGACECPKCKAFEAAHGGVHSATVVNFANKVAEAVEKEFPNVNVVTFAYTYSRQAPTGIVPRKNVWIELCSIECDFAHPLRDDTDYGFTKDIIDWGKLTKNLTIWDYVTCFTNYQIPYPNVGILADNIRFFTEHGAIGLFEQSDQMCLTGDFVRFRNWYLYKLMWNQNLDEKKLMREFLYGYYSPEIGKYLEKYFNAINKRVKKVNYAQRCYYTDTLTWLDIPTFNKMSSAMESALKKAEELEKSNPEKYKNLVKKIRREKLPIDYVTVMNYAQLHALANKQGEKVNLPDDVVALAKDIVARWKEFNIEKINQHETRKQFEKFMIEIVEYAKNQTDFIKANPSQAESADIKDNIAKAGTYVEFQEGRIDQSNFMRKVTTYPVVYVADKNASNGYAAKLTEGCELHRRFELQIRDDLKNLKSESGNEKSDKYRVMAFVRSDMPHPSNATIVSHMFRRGDWKLFMDKTQKADFAGEKYKMLDCGTIQLDSSRKDFSCFQLWFRILGTKKPWDFYIDRIIIVRE